MSDPFVRQPSDGLETSTAITRVDDEAMSHAAEDVMRQVEAVVGSKSKRGNKRPKAPAVFNEPAEPGFLTMAEPSPEAEASDNVDAASVPTMEGEPESPADTVPATTATAEADVEPLPVQADAAPSPRDEPLPLVVLADVATTTPHDMAVAYAEAPAASLGDENVLTELSLTVSRVLQLNMACSIALWTSLMRVRTPADVVKVHTSHLHHQMDNFISQSAEISALARKASAMSITSLVDTFDRFKV